MEHLFGAADAGDGAAIDLGEQLRVTGCDDIDEVLVESFLGGVGVRGMDSSGGGFWVTAAQDDVGAQRGFGIVLDLLRHGGVRLAAELEHGVSGAGIGSRGHGGNVRGLKEEEACRAGTRARGRNVDDDGNAGAKDGFDHAMSGLKQTAGSVELDQKGTGAVGVRLGESAIEFAGGDGLDGIGEDQLVNMGLLRTGGKGLLRAGGLCEGRRGQGTAQQGYGNEAKRDGSFHFGSLPSAAWITVL